MALTRSHPRSSRPIPGQKCSEPNYPEGPEVHAESVEDKILVLSPTPYACPVRTVLGLLLLWQRHPGVELSEALGGQRHWSWLT